MPLLTELKIIMLDARAINISLLTELRYVCFLNRETKMTEILAC